MTALEGVRVIDQTQVMAGPMCTMLLADMGADVIKVEPPGGEHMRQGELEIAPGVAAPFLAVNRGKRSLALDLKHPDGLAVARRLARAADVLVESFRPGVAARLGLEYPALRDANPRLVYCSVSAFGQAGPLAERPGLDPVVQCYGGLAWEQGIADDAAPVLVRGSLVDYYTGSLAAAGILLALLGRARTGAGQYLETSLLDGVLAMQAGRLFWAEAREPREAVRDLLGDRVSRIYPTRDGYVYLYVELPKFWEGLCRTLGFEAWLADPRLQTMVGRHTHKTELIAAITERLAVRSAAEWETRFEAADVPCTRIRSIPEMLEDAQARANGTLATATHPAFGLVRFLGVPVRLSETPGTPPGPPPGVGEHADAILVEAGYTPEEVARLRTVGVIR